MLWRKAVAVLAVCECLQQLLTPQSNPLGFQALISRRPAGFVVVCHAHQYICDRLILADRTATRGASGVVVQPQMQFALSQRKDE